MNPVPLFLVVALVSATVAGMVQTGLVFGAFDGLHEGHRRMLTQAREQCAKLVVVLAVPEAVRLLKRRVPRQSFDERRAALLAFNPRIVIEPSDAAIGTWQVFERIRPDMIFLGYDQQMIASELERLGMPYAVLDPHHPERYKSSLLAP